MRRREGGRGLGLCSADVEEGEGVCDVPVRGGGGGVPAVRTSGGVCRMQRGTRESGDEGMSHLQVHHSAAHPSVWTALKERPACFKLSGHWGRVWKAMPLGGCHWVVMLGCLSNNTAVSVNGMGRFGV